MVRIVHIGAEAGMRLEAPAAGKINGTRADVVDRGAAVIFDCNLLARRGFGNSGFRRRVGALVLARPVERQSQAAREITHGGRETLAEGGGTIIG